RPRSSVEPRRLAEITKRKEFRDHIRLLEKFVKLCRDNNVTLVVATVPLHREVARRYDATDVAGAISQVSHINPVWDFSDSEWLSDRPEFWPDDNNHFSVYVSKMMVRRIFGDDMPTGWEHFGRLRKR